MVADALELENERDPFALAGKNNVALSRKPRNREVSSRYKIAGAAAAPPPSARRFPSPNVRLGDPGPPLDPPKRALSAERKREEENPSGAKKVWSSCQNIIGTSQSLVLSDGVAAAGSNKAKADHALKPAANRARGATPERKRNFASADQAENARPIENLASKVESQKWLGTANGNSISKSLDLSLGRTASRGNRHFAPARSFNQLTGLNAGKQESKKPSRPVTMETCVEDSKFDTSVVRSVPDKADLASCDSDAAESSVDPQQQHLEVPGAEKNSRISKAARGTVVPARFWQDLGSRIRRLSDANQLRSSMPEGEFIGSKTSRRSTKGGNSAPSSAGNTPAHPAQPPPSWSYSPVRAPTAPLSPSSTTKVSSPSRSLPSPTKTRTMAPNGAVLYQGARPGSVACMLNFGAEGRKTMSQQDEAICLRILHNRWLQWRYVNARSDSALSTQKATGERVLYNASLQISDLQNRVAEKRIRLQKARQEARVHSVIASHGEQLEEWAKLEPDHILALSGAIEALEAGTLKVPVTGGAKVDIPTLQTALNSAADAMLPLESITREILPNAEKTSEIVCELAYVSAQGKALLQECGELLDRIATLEIEERSLRSYAVQLDSEKKHTTRN